MFIIENRNGTQLNLSDNPYAYLINIDGQTRGITSLSSAVNGTMDGDIVNNVIAQPRTLIFDLRMRGNVEESKRQILRVVKLKQKCSVLWSQSGRDLKIDGIVEAVEMPRWNNYVTMQITIHCENPFWESLNGVVTSINDSIPAHYFTESGDMLAFPDGGIPLGIIDFSRTRTLENKGDVAVGMTIEIVAHSTVTNPIIYDDEGNFFGLGTSNQPVELSAGESITISTERGKKSVYKGDENLIDSISPNSVWLQLQAGLNTLTINSDEEETDNLTFNISFVERYI